MGFKLYISNSKDLPNKLYQGGFIEEIILDDGGYSHGIQYFLIDPDLKEEVLIDEGIEYLEKISYMSQYHLSFYVNVDTARFLGTLKLHDTFSYEDYRGDTITPDEWEIEIPEPSLEVDTHWRQVIITIKFNFFTKLANNANYEEELNVATPPYATGVSITGDNAEGSTLTGNYTYNDDEDDAEGASEFKWYRSNDQFGTNKQLISGETTTSYIIAVDDLNKWLTFQVKPVSTLAPTDGDWVESDYFVIANNTAPEAQNLAVTPDPANNGDLLFATYDFFDADGDLEGLSIYRFYFDNGTGYTLLSQGTNSTFLKFTPDSAHYNSYYIFSVEPIAATGVLNGVETFTEPKLYGSMPS